MQRSEIVDQLQLSIVKGYIYLECFYADISCLKSSEITGSYFLNSLKMKRFYKALAILFWVFIGVHTPGTLYAQRENNIWYFGNQAGVTFSSGSPVAISNSMLSSYEACASISDAAGNLVMYSNGENVWDANHQLMPNGSNLGGHTSASQGVLLLKHPGNATQYFIFIVDAIDNNLVGGLRYSVVDMSLRGGLGDVVANTKSVRLPTPTLSGKVTEKLTAGLHSNGRDYWIVVHGWQSNTFYSFLLSPNGISTTPVVSSVGPVHTGGGSFFGAANAVGYMKISPLGTHLALAERDRQFELYSFNKTTGSVSNYVPLTVYGDHYSGIEFSPDNSRLYTSTYTDGGFSSTIYQYNLLAGSASAINNSQQTIANLIGLSVALQSAPNNKIYLAAFNTTFLHAINAPNALGTACGLIQNAVSLGQRTAQVGLPNFPNAFATQTLATASQQLNEQATVYPNPAQDMVWVRLPDALFNQEAEFTIFDEVGKKVLQKQLSVSTNSAGTAIKLPSLSEGMYTLQVATKAGIISKKLVVQ
jgi:hypothetical protein